MIKVSMDMEMPAPPEVVFDLLADHTKHPIWDPNMLDASGSVSVWPFYLLLTLMLLAIRMWVL